jgi:hypothetical protein
MYSWRSVGVAAALMNLCDARLCERITEVHEFETVHRIPISSLAKKAALLFARTLSLA